MADIVIARKSGAVRGPDGERIMIRAGRTIADADHPAVLAHPKAWVPVNVALRTDPGSPPGGDEPQDPKQAEFQEHALELRRLAEAARGLDVLPDRPLTAGEVVDHVVAILDDYQRRPGETTEADRETIRAWARTNGLDVADKGRLSKAVEDAYRAAHGG